MAIIFVIAAAIDMNRKFIVLEILAILAFASQTHADWIKGIFSEEAGIDSLERFLVVRDIDSCRVLGEPIVPLGDINGDSCSDVLLVRSEGRCFEPNPSFLFYGGRPPDSIYNGQYGNFWIMTANIGDINGDGYDDIGNFRCLPNHVEICYGSEVLTDIAEDTVQDIYTEFTRAADMDNDGCLELPLSTNVNGGPVDIFQIDSTGVLTPVEYVIFDTSRSFGGNLATGDFNGDGNPDLAVAAFLGRDSSFVKFYWGGPGFDTIPDFEIWRKAENFGSRMLPLGDFNGDGYEDIFIDGGVADGWSIPGGIFFGGPYIDNTLDIVTNRFTYGGYFNSTSAAVAGDVNHDGYPDLVIGVDFDPGSLYEMKIFLGGPEADSIPDVYLESGLITHRQMNLGSVVAGVGDFNGDGIDDFAGRSRTTSGCCWWGEVNFFAGWDSDASDVGYEFEPTYPKAFDLKQNYPNPFNLSTTIEFDLPRHSHARLVVYSLLGERITTLLDRDLPAGLHRVTWAGADSSGHTVASGVYFYRVVTDAYSQTRKMVLMK
ncbi:MAG: FG-GAP-like repeat-containing protein [candidate division Zixibacteria bacterium]|nr:FG-GAP-like repeat-containing protein [candidate division Zixibacteria bacterium]